MSQQITSIAGDPYCGSCGYSLKGLENSTKCPECGKPIVAVLMRRSFQIRQGKRYRSKATLFGLPIIDIAVGPMGNEKRGKARGIIAIGDFATGWIAIGGLARGIFAVGGLAIGVFPFGGLAIGLLTAAGGLAASLGMSVGGISIGAAASGGLAIGLIAQGGCALGIIAQGGAACGKYARGAAAFGNHSPAMFENFRWILGTFPPEVLDTFRPLAFAFVPGIVAAIAIGAVSLVRLKSESSIKSDL